MNNENLFSSVGITVHNGNAKVRFTDDMVRRIKQFTKGGATRCEFIELPNPMTKVEALNYMLSRPEFESDADQATINDALADRTPRTSKAKTAPSLEAIAARAKNKTETTTEDVLNAVADS